ncbi:ATP synthase F1 subunit gamma [Caloranaerobacter azorensis]|uniref:ATP synthase gamma chain n=2 Tax=Caloranaerobacter azorensis TaxID=116090 RepID=A0A096BII1_9FIRM|nr:ATP synthase F1 subunit gamma [Caloranaerobacter azorensis]KGG80672.1 ATP F0F1 synthase subunit gamma [Caloranaerobacter azorensis H53214]QIB27652.1 ATP synthase F1 subunit gamma [Caloranaerobacter azorensis]
MAQAGMRDIKRRIRSVSSTKQITKAMELVSSAKLRRAREKLEKTRPYYNTIVRSIRDILTSTSGIRHPFLEKREVKKAAYIVITADRGLCGGYNNNVIKLTEENIKNKDNAVIIAVGQKARDFFKKRGYNLAEEFVHISENPNYSHAREIGDIVINLYKMREIDEVNIVYTQFESTISQVTKIMKLLPAENVVEKGDRKKTTLVEYEPSPEEVLDYLIPKYIHSVIYGAMIEASASEQAARRNAMESATDNAQEMIENLKLSYNRARQASITQEIAEIVGGAEALK